MKIQTLTMQNLKLIMLKYTKKIVMMKTLKNQKRMLFLENQIKQEIMLLMEISQNKMIKIGNLKLLLMVWEVLK